MRKTRLLVHLQHFLLGRPPGPGQPRPVLLAARSSTIFIAATVCLAIFTDIFLYGLIVPVVPFALTVQVGTPESEAQRWTAILLACYSGALFLGAPVAGFYADRTSSRRGPLLVGLVALAGSTLLLCLGKTIALLVVGRIAQGLSAAVVWSVGLALLADTVGDNIGVAMGWVSISMSAGLLISPVVGGAVYDAAGYYAVFYVGFAVVFLDIVLRLVLIEKKVARRWLDDGRGEGIGREERMVGKSEGTAAIAGQGKTSICEAEKGAQPGGVEKDCALAEEKCDSSKSSEAREDGEKAQCRAERESAKAAKQESEQIPGTASERRRHPILSLIRSPRMCASLYGIVAQAGVMYVQMSPSYRSPEDL